MVALEILKRIKKSILSQVTIIGYQQDTAFVQFSAKKKMFLTRKERADSIDADKPIYIITENVDNVSCLTF